jgi:hypothetical protein
MSRRCYGPCSWFALLATLASLLSPAATLAENQAITLYGDGGDAWAFEKSLEGDLPDGGCDRVLIASPRATVEAWQAEGRFGAIVPLLEGDNEVRAICRVGEADRSVSEPQHWTVRLRDAPKAWIRIVPVEDEIVLDGWRQRASSGAQRAARRSPRAQRPGKSGTIDRGRIPGAATGHGRARPHRREYRCVPGREWQAACRRACRGAAGLARQGHGVWRGARGVRVLGARVRDRRLPTVPKPSERPPRVIH